MDYCVAKQAPTASNHTTKIISSLNYSWTFTFYFFYFCLYFYLYMYFFLYINFTFYYMFTSLLTLLILYFYFSLYFHFTFGWLQCFYYAVLKFERWVYLWNLSFCVAICKIQNKFVCCNYKLDVQNAFKVVYFKEL